jgi:uncharacterized membrane protein
MDQLLFHPKVVHLPIALAILMPLVSAGLLAAWAGGFLPRRVWVIAALLQALLVGTGWLALETGENEEDRVERVVAEKLIDAHAEAAEAFVWGAGAILLLHLAVVAIRDEKTARAAASAATLGTLLVLFLGYRTGEAGGALVYRHGAASAYAAATTAIQPQQEDDD